MWGMRYVRHDGTYGTRNVQHESTQSTRHVRHENKQGTRHVRRHRKKDTNKWDPTTRRVRGMKEDARARRVHNLADSSLDIFNVYYEKWWLNTEVMVEPRGTLHVVLEIQKYLPFKPQNFKMGSFTFFLLDFSSFRVFLISFYWLIGTWKVCMLDQKPVRAVL